MPDHRTNGMEQRSWHDLAAQASAVRDQHWGRTITYSRKVFIPLTRLCSDVCHYCTFATAPRNLKSAYLSPDEVLAIAAAGAASGCKEALFTLGDAPERRYARAREALEALGYQSTLDYVLAMAKLVAVETGLLPHLNPGLMSPQWLARLRPVSASMGLMLESASPRLSARGGPHFGSPDKHPAARLTCIEDAGAARIPFTSGILVGIGETRAERLQSLLALRALHERHGHLQEVIVQNFRAKPGTKMAAVPEPDREDFLWTVAAARLLLPIEVSLQAPPNLWRGELTDLLAAGINDWGGVSPVTPDHVNPEAPWPHLDSLADRTAAAGFRLAERLTVYPRFIEGAAEWIAPEMAPRVLRLADAGGLSRGGEWTPGAPARNAADEFDLRPRSGEVAGARIRDIVAAALAGKAPDETEIVHLFSARGADYAHVTQAADELRRRLSGDAVGYVVNRNINYTNICLYSCGFCAFSKGRGHDSLRGSPYVLPHEELHRRVAEAWSRGATEVCMQGGIHPAYTGQTYLDILAVAKQAAPDIHVHAFSPLEIQQGAGTLGLSTRAFLEQLKVAGLGSLPGTAAEILDDEVRAIICPDKLSTTEWLRVIGEAHESGLPTTSTMMFGHVEHYRHWARHLLALRVLQQRTGGITEFVPLPFVPMESPLYRKGRTRRGPSWRETMLVHAIARLVFGTLIPNIQASWVKLGPQGVAAALAAGANDIGGTLMNESISKAAGAAFGEEFPPAQIEALIRQAGRKARLRTTLYGDAPYHRREVAFTAAPLAALRIPNPVRQARQESAA